MRGLLYCFLIEPNSKNIWNRVAKPKINSQKVRIAKLKIEPSVVKEIKRSLWTKFKHISPIYPKQISKQNIQTKQNFQINLPTESSKHSFLTEYKLSVIFRVGLQTVIPLLIRGVTAYALRFWAVTHLIWYALVRVTMARWSPITQYVVFYPDLLAVGGGTRDMYAGIVRQDYTGAHIHALGWTSPQRLFILRL